MPLPGGLPLAPTGGIPGWLLSFPAFLPLWRVGVFLLTSPSGSQQSHALSLLLLPLLTWP